MRYVFTRGEKSLRTAGEDQTDDRGLYRIYGLEPGDYMVSAIPRNQNIGDLRQTIMSEVESLQQQVQAAGGRGAGLGRAGGPELVAAAADRRCSIASARCSSS